MIPRSPAHAQYMGATNGLDAVDTARVVPIIGAIERVNGRWGPGWGPGGIDDVDGAPAGRTTVENRERFMERR